MSNIGFLVWLWNQGVPGEKPLCSNGLGKYKIKLQNTSLSYSVKTKNIIIKLSRLEAMFFKLLSINDNSFVYTAEKPHGEAVTNIMSTIRENPLNKKNPL